ncbi:MAG: hypothetical protein ABIA04_05185 [Pseudomonadota bacterium]
MNLEKIKLLLTLILVLSLSLPLFSFSPIPDDRVSDEFSYRPVSGADILIEPAQNIEGTEQAKEVKAEEIDLSFTEFSDNLFDTKIQDSPSKTNLCMAMAEMYLEGYWGNEMIDWEKVIVEKALNNITDSCKEAVLKELFAQSKRMHKRHEDRCEVPGKVYDNTYYTASISFLNKLDKKNLADEKRKVVVKSVSKGEQEMSSAYYENCWYIDQGLVWLEDVAGNDTKIRNTALAMTVDNASAKKYVLAMVDSLPNLYKDEIENIETTTHDDSTVAGIQDAFKEKCQDKAFEDQKICMDAVESLFAYEQTRYLVAQGCVASGRIKSNSSAKMENCYAQYIEMYTNDTEMAEQYVDLLYKKEVAQAEEYRSLIVADFEENMAKRYYALLNNFGAKAGSTFASLADRNIEEAKRYATLAEKAGIEVASKYNKLVTFLGSEIANNYYNEYRNGNGPTADKYASIVLNTTLDNRIVYANHYLELTYLDNNAANKYASVIQKETSKKRDIKSAEAYYELLASASTEEDKSTARVYIDLFDLHKVLVQDHFAFSKEQMYEIKLAVFIARRTQKLRNDIEITVVADDRAYNPPVVIEYAQGNSEVIIYVNERGRNIDPAKLGSRISREL